MNKKRLTLFAILCSALVNGQDWAEKMQEPEGNYYDIKASFESYWANRDISEKGKGYKAFKRWENFVERRVYPSGNLSQLALTQKNYEAFLQEYNKQHSGGPGKSLGNSGLTASSTWTPMGPFGAITGNASGQFLKSGRINFITILPGNSNILWIGAPAGGLWKSTNGGNSWTTNTDNLAVNGCSDLAIDPTNTLVMYLATGDGNAGDTRSIGVLKSSNGGLSWNTTGLTNAVTTNFLIRRLLINPNNTQILLAATNTGIYRTINGGNTWTQVNTSNTFDLEFKPGNPNIVYAGGTSFRMSTNGGLNWTQITNGIPNNGINRMAVAVTSADTNYVYVLASNSTGSGYQGFYRSTVGGTLFTASSNTLNLLGWSSAGTDTGGQGWYDLCIAASPLNKDEVVTGGVNVWRTTNGGSSFSIYGHWTGSGAPFTHADQHDLEYDASGTLFNTNDGTVYKRTGNTWTEISGTINVSQIYRIGPSSQTANKWITGHQDNGTSIWTGTTYSAALGGDGMDCFFDRTNDNNVFGEYQNGGMRRSTNGGSNWSNATSGLTGTAPWVTIWKQDPSVSTRLYCGWENMFVSNNLAVSWSSLTALPTPTGGVREFAIAPSNNQIIYVLKSSGIFKTTNGGSTWTNVTGSVPVGSAAPDYICIDPTDPNNAWVVLSGYSSGNKVFVTTNGGTSWTNYSSNLPNIPGNCIVYEPGSSDRVYVGMDVGIYYRDNTMSNWVLYNNSLPNVPISELEISPASPTLLYAATYGRGVWVASLFAPGYPPISSFTTGVGSICMNSAVTFTDLSTLTPTAWAWSVVPSAGVVISSSSSQNPSITFPGPGTYTVNLTASNGFGNGNTYSTVYSVNGLPNVIIGSSSPSVCPGAAVSFTATGATSYSWSNGGGNSAVVNYTPSSPTIYTVSAMNNGCVGSKTVGVGLYPLPTPVINGPVSVCYGDQALLQATGVTSFTWSTGATNFAFITVNPSVTSVYSITATGGNGCKGSATHTVVVNPLPNIVISANDTLLCLNEPLVLTASGAVNYSWQPGMLTGMNANYVPGSTQTYTCIGEDNSGCMSLSVLTVSVNLCESVRDINPDAGTLFNVYPVPVGDKLIISAKNIPEASVYMELSDVTGKIILKQNLEFSSEQTEVSVSALAPGVYFLSLKVDKSGALNFKVVKE